MKQRPCLLLSPPDVGRVFPRGLVELGSFLKSRGQLIEILPLAHHLDPPADGLADSVWADGVQEFLEPILREIRPAVIGISNLFTVHYLSCLKILEVCKRIEPEAVSVIGGPHVSFQTDVTLSNSFVDVVVRGEGEWTMLELLEAIGAERPLAHIPGLSYKVSGNHIHNADRPVGDLCELPPPNLTLLPEEYLRHCEIYGMMNRGCKYRCSFCSERLFWKKRRDYPIERIVTEFERFERDYGNRVIGIEDSMIHLGSPQFKEFCRLMRSKKMELSPEFFLLSRVDTIDDKGLRAMISAGIRNVRLGIESGSEIVRKLMNKGFSNQQVFDTCERIVDAGAKAMAFWIIGHPGENPQEAQVSLKMLDRLLGDKLIDAAVVSLFLPYPGTSFFSDPQAFGLEILSYDWPRWKRWTENPICQSEGFKAEQIRKIYLEALDLLVHHGQHLRQLPYEGEFSEFLAKRAALHNKRTP